jgi:hypothetical protein
MTTVPKMITLTMTIGKGWSWKAEKITSQLTPPTMIITLLRQPMRLAPMRVMRR